MDEKFDRTSRGNFTSVVDPMNLIRIFRRFKLCYRNERFVYVNATITKDIRYIV